MIESGKFQTTDGYTFDEGVAFLRLCEAPEGVVMHIAATHNRSHLHSEIHKQLRMPGTMRLLREKGYGKAESATVAATPETEPKSDEIEPKSDEIEPKSDDGDVPRPEDPRPDSTEIILTADDVRRHTHTRLEDMPNDLCRTLWLKRQDVHREMQQCHLKMRQVPEGEENNAERAKWRAEVLRLDAENDAYWQQIDAEIERFEAEKQRAKQKAEEKPDFDVSTYRAYVSKALRKRKLTPAQLAELQHRVTAMMEAKVEIKAETLEKLKAIGINA